MAPVSKSDFATALRVDRSRVSQLVRNGLPVTSDGQIELCRGLQWVVEHVDISSRAPDGGIAVRAKKLLAGMKGGDSEEVVGSLPRRMTWFRKFKKDPDLGLFVAGATEMTYRAPACAADLAVRLGVPLNTAFKLQEALKVMLAWEAIDAAGIEDGVVEWWPADFWGVDWNSYADERGEAVDLDAWRAELRELPL